MEGAPLDANTSAGQGKSHGVVPSTALPTNADSVPQAPTTEGAGDEQGQGGDGEGEREEVRFVDVTKSATLGGDKPQRKKYGKEAWVRPSGKGEGAED